MPDSRPSLISVENISKVFRSRDGADVAALDGCSLEVLEGEFVCIVGPSGCGKTTLLRVIAGLTDVTAGEVRVHGGLAERRLGMVFQKPVLLPWRTSLENVLLPVALRGLPERGYREKAQAILETVGLRGFEHKYPYELSGGMQQRVAISRALILDPQVLLMDEPFGALDALTRNTMNVELLRIWEENRSRSIVFITHSIPEAIFLADRVVVMSARPGRVLSVFSIDLPRPRSIDYRHSNRFAEYGEAIGSLLGVRAVV